MMPEMVSRRATEEEWVEVYVGYSDAAHAENNGREGKPRGNGLKSMSAIYIYRVISVILCIQKWHCKEGIKRENRLKLTSVEIKTIVHSH